MEYMFSEPATDQDMVERVRVFVYRDGSLKLVDVALECSAARWRLRHTGGVFYWRDRFSSAVCDLRQFMITGLDHSHPSGVRHDRYVELTGGVR